MRPLSLGVLLLPVLAGCGGSYVPVSGRVTLNDKPLPNAAVTFQPVATEGSSPGPGSGGTTDADGRYTLSVVGSGATGAVVGKHKVRITLVPQEDPTDDRPKKHKELPSRYNLKTTLEFNVPAGGTDAANFALKAP